MLWLMKLYFRMIPPSVSNIYLSMANCYSSNWTHWIVDRMMFSYLIRGVSVGRVRWSNNLMSFDPIQCARRIGIVIFPLRHKISWFNAGRLATVRVHKLHLQVLMYGSQGRDLLLVTAPIEVRLIIPSLALTDIQRQLDRTCPSMGCLPARSWWLLANLNVYYTQLRIVVINFRVLATALGVISSGRGWVKNPLPTILDSPYLRCGDTNNCPSQWTWIDR